MMSIIGNIWMGGVWWGHNMIRVIIAYFGSKHALYYFDFCLVFLSVSFLHILIKLSFSIPYIFHQLFLQSALVSPDLKWEIQIFIWTPCLVNFLFYHPPSIYFIHTSFFINIYHFKWKTIQLSNTMPLIKKMSPWKMMLNPVLSRNCFGLLIEKMFCSWLLALSSL